MPKSANKSERVLVGPWGTFSNTLHIIALYLRLIRAYSVYTVYYELYIYMPINFSEEANIISGASLLESLTIPLHIAKYKEITL